MPALENARHEAFARGVAAGSSQRDAYMEAYPKSLNWKPQSVTVSASRLARDPVVQARIRELIEEAANGSVLTRQNRLAMLSEIASDEKNSSKARLGAIDLLNKMQGDYIKRSEVTVVNDLAVTASEVAAILEMDGDDDEPATD